ALELLDAQCLLVDVREQPTRGLAVEADGGNELVAPRDLSRPRDGIELLPIVPALDGRVRGETSLARYEVARHGMQRPRGRLIHRAVLIGLMYSLASGGGAAPRRLAARNASSTESTAQP